MCSSPHLGPPLRGGARVRSAARKHHGAKGALWVWQDQKCLRRVLGSAQQRHNPPILTHPRSRMHSFPWLPYPTRGLYRQAAQSRTRSRTRLYRDPPRTERAALAAVRGSRSPGLGGPSARSSCVPSGGGAGKRGKGVSVGRLAVFVCRGSFEQGKEIQALRVSTRLWPRTRHGELAHAAHSTLTTGRHGNPGASARSSAGSAPPQCRYPHPYRRAPGGASAGSAAASSAGSPAPGGR